MRKSLRWYKNWKCSIKRTHLNVWLVKVNVVLQIFHLSHSMRSLLLVMPLRVPLCALWSAGQAWLMVLLLVCCWMLANIPRPILHPHFPKPATLKKLSSIRCIYSFPGRDVTNITCPGICWASTGLLPENSQSSARSTRPGFHWDAPERNTPALTFSHKVLGQNLEKPPGVGYNFGPNTSGTSAEVSSILQL